VKNDPRGSDPAAGILFGDRHFESAQPGLMENSVTDTRADVHPVESCNLGKLGDDELALRINFLVRETDGQRVPHHAVFGLSRNLAEGLIKGLTALLEEKSAPAAKH
jgi:hypothetical protein